MIITTEDLLQANACTTDPLDRFGGQWEYGEWTPEVQIGVLMSDLRKYLGWLWHNSIVPQWSMKGWNLRRADLSGADLYGADLRGAFITDEQIESAIGGER